MIVDVFYFPRFNTKNNSNCNTILRVGCDKSNESVSQEIDSFDPCNVRK
jgi:hypothetical protein